MFPQPCSASPAAPANFLAYLVGNVVTLVRDPAADGGAPTSYLVNVSGAFSASVLISTRAISGFVGPGTYSFSVLAVNACGPSTATAVQTIVGSVTPVGVLERSDDSCGQYATSIQR